MRHLPALTYSGLTIVLDRPSRHDDKSGKLLTGYADTLIAEALYPVTNRYQCDVRTSDTIGQGLLPNTKALLLLGDTAFKSWTDGKYDSYTLGEQRGCPLETNWGVPTICSYFPQNCLDFKDYEGNYWKESESEDYNFSDEKDDEGETAVKRHGKTARGNWRFWLTRDCKKIGRTLAKGIPSEPSPEYIIYPNSEEIIKLLNETENSILYLDIETDSEYNILCIGFSLNDYSRIYVVPLLRYDYTLAYGDITTCRILSSLASCMARNETVAHNSAFDLIVLAWKYRLPFGRHIYDTMLAQQRCFPECEKSLGHCVSLHTWQPFHKDEGIFMPANSSQEMKLWQYNGKDVYTMMLVREAIDRYALTQPGLVDSIKEVNSSIYAYLLNTLLGIRYDQQVVDSIIHENDRLGEQYYRIIKLLIGRELKPRSSKDCAKYFHEEMGYKVLGRTEGGAPKLDEKNLYKLKIVHPENMIIDLIFAYRRKLNETSKFLMFNPWEGIATSPYYEQPTSISIQRDTIQPNTSV